MNIPKSFSVFDAGSGVSGTFSDLELLLENSAEINDLRVVLGNMRLQEIIVRDDLVYIRRVT